MIAQKLVKPGNRFRGHRFARLFARYALTTLSFLVASLMPAYVAHAGPPIDAYAVLGVEPTVSQGQLTTAWRTLTKTFMPLANQGDAAALDSMKQINQAWDLVKSREKRAAYDASRGQSRSTSPGAEPFKDTNVEEVLARHPEWASFLSDYERGVSDPLAKRDFSTLLHIYEEMIDETFVRTCFKKLAELDDSPALREALKKIIDIEMRNHPPHPRAWNLGQMSRHVFSKPKFLALTAALLPRFMKAAHRYDLRGLGYDVFPKEFSLPLGDGYLWEAIRRTRDEEDKGTLFMMAEGIFRDGETGSRRDPELLVALVQEEGRQIMASRILAWRYRPEWGGRGLQAIIDKADSDSLTGLRKRLATPEFLDSRWNIYREALTHPDRDAGPELRTTLGELILNEPAPMPLDCDTMLGDDDSSGPSLPHDELRMLAD